MIRAGPMGPTGKALFIAGTDTGVGKTVAAAALAIASGAGVMKPIACGGGDTEFLIGATGSRDPADRVTPVFLRAPRAPLVAARLEGREIDPAALLEAVAAMRARHRRLVVEGVGGVRVPICRSPILYEVRDLIRDLGLPAVIVARTGLGTINHAAMTFDALAERGVMVAGFLLNDGAASVEDDLAGENAEAIREMTGMACLGRIRPDPEVLAGRHAVSAATVEAVRAVPWGREATA